MGFLEAWKESKHRKPLFYRAHDRSERLIPFWSLDAPITKMWHTSNFETNPKLNETFEENISPDYLIPILSHIAGQTIVKKRR